MVCEIWPPFRQVVRVWSGGLVVDGGAGRVREA